MEGFHGLRRLSLGSLDLGRLRGSPGSLAELADHRPWLAGGYLVKLEGKEGLVGHLNLRATETS